MGASRQLQALPGPRTLAQQVAQRIRAAIIFGELPSGQPLKQAELATRFGVSPIPLREALRLLEAERFVTLHPYRGAVVADLSAGELRELADIFLALETLALRLAVPKMTAETLRQATSILASMKATDDPDGWGVLSIRLHMTLCAPAGRPKLLKMMRNLLVNLSRYRRLGLPRTSYRDRSERRYTELLAACEARDAPSAVRIIEEHVGTTSQEAIAYLERAQTRRARG